MKGTENKGKTASVAEMAEKWGLSERSVRNYCALGRIHGAFLIGKIWHLPVNAAKPERANKARSPSPLLPILREQMHDRYQGGIYHRVQIDLTYNSNHMEGSRLTHDQTRWIFETNTIGLGDGTVNVDDILETVNHFRCIDRVIVKATSRLTEKFIKELHGLLKNGTADSRRPWFAVGEYKRMANEVGGRETTAPDEVPTAMGKLLSEYNERSSKSLEDLLAFHVAFERIHPFQDGNGRIGRLILFKECLRHNILPFILEDDLKLFYYRGLQEWDRAEGYLLDTCRTAQDRFKGLLRYFGIARGND